MSCADCPPPRLDSWVRLADGRFEGSSGEQKLWIRPARTEGGTPDAPEFIWTANGARYELGGRRGAERPSSSFYGVVTRRQSRAQRLLAAAGSTWPTLTVIATISLSNAYGVMPGTCIGPAAL